LRLNTSSATEVFMQSIPADRVFKALADPTRRAMLERLAMGPASPSELAMLAGVGLSTVDQHLKLLEAVGLVRSQKHGRVRTCLFVPDSLALAQDWLSTQRSLWERRCDQLDQYLLTMKDDE